MDKPSVQPKQNGESTATEEASYSFLKLKSPWEKAPDVFDHDEFDAIKFINQIYPDESSLGDLDKFITLLRKQIRAVDKEIFQAVRSQGGAHTRARQDLTTATSQIQELFTKIRDIQRKAEESEAMVQEICRDIKKLDYAKKHLTNAITALRRLAMVTAAVTDLEQVASRRDQYKKCANLLEAVAQLLEYFQQYEAIPKVRNLTRRIHVVQTHLGDSVLDDFKMVMGAGDGKLPHDALDRLSQACAVADALGPKVHDTLMDWLCDREMTIYQAIFSMGGEGGKLDRFERRFVWFRARLDEKKEQWAIFPDAWRVPQVLCLTFCKITKAHAKRILSEGDGSELAADIAPLIKTVVAAVKFEREMNVIFGHGPAEDDEDDLDTPGDSISASEARKRLERFRHKARKEAEAKHKATSKAAEAREAEVGKVSFEGAVSEAFEDSLRVYVAEEEKELVAHVETCVREEHEHRWVPNEDDHSSRVLSSANKLFYKIRASFTRCSKLISRGQTLLALAQVFKRVIAIYANELTRRLPKTASGATSAAAPYTGNEWHIRMAEDEEQVVCHILATAAFCKETTEGLAAALAKDVKPALADQVDLTEEEGLFLGVASQGLNVLVLGVNTKLDGALTEMIKIRWDAIEQPGDDSPFVATVRRSLAECGPHLGQLLDSFTFAFFCDKMARMFIPRYYEGIYKLKKISEKGTLQLSIDTEAIKRVLLDFPHFARRTDHDAQEMSSYVHYVEREFGHVVNLVKVLQAKPENLVDTFMLLLPSQHQSVADFTRLCELKVLTRKQIADLVAVYTRRLSGGEATGPLGTGFTAAAPPAAAASSLGAFKAGMTSLTRELAHSISFLDRTALPEGSLPPPKGTSWLRPADGTAPGLPKPVPSYTSLSFSSVPAAAEGAPYPKGVSSSMRGPTEGAVPGEGPKPVAAHTTLSYSTLPAAPLGAIKETAAKTKEGFARFGSMMRGVAAGVTMPAPGSADGRGQ